MNAEFNWWLLIVGLGIGAGLAWLVLADMGRRREAASDQERADEVAWIRAVLDAEGDGPDESRIDRVIELHERWVEAPGRPTEDAATAGPGPDGPSAGAAAITGPADDADATAPEANDPTDR